MYQLIIFIQILVILAGFVIIPVTLTRKYFHGVTSYTLFIAGIMIQSYGYLIELTGKSVDTIIIGKQIQQFGYAFISLFLVIFLQIYYKRTINRKLTITLIVYNVILLSIVSTCNCHKLYYMSVNFVQDSLFPHVVVKHGIFYYISYLENLIVNGYVLWSIIQHFFSLNVRKRKLQLGFLSACSIPCIANIISLTGIFKEYNPLNASFSIASILVLISIYRHRFFDIIHTARDNIIESLDEALIVVDNDYQLLDHNPAADRLFPELIHANRNSYIYDISIKIYELLIQKTPPEFESNEHYYQTQINKIYNKLTVVGYIVCVSDITQSRIHMENLIQLREQAEYANKSKSVFLANMSHEIRTPLNAILGSTDILLSQRISYQERSTLMSIKTAGAALLKMLNDILDFSKIDSGKLSFSVAEYKLTTIIQDVIGIISVKLIHKPVILQVEVQQDLPKYLLGDEMRLRQILINVLNNAVKFTDKGSIHFSCNSLYDIDNNSDEITLVFQISDTGRGISKENQKRIFDSFERIIDSNHNPTEGNGLGLAICEKILSSLGGSISVESELEIGSTFTICVPQHISHEIHENMVNNKTGNLTENNRFKDQYSVLVVDDNLVNLQVAYGLLEIYDLKVDLASSGKEALQLLEKNTYHIVFLDYMMPEMNGIDTLNAIRELTPSYCKTVPVIALTANALSGAEEMFLSSGFNGFLSKPMEINRLSIILSKWLSIDLHTAKMKLWELPNTRKDIFKDFSQIYEIDWVQGLSNCDGNWDAYFELLDIFWRDGLGKVKELTTSLFNADYSLYSVQVHAIKSSLAAIGAKELTKYALSLELACAENKDKAVLETHHNDFIQKFTVLCFAINGVLSSTAKLDI